jgi:hypothetical protein
MKPTQWYRDRNAKIAELSKTMDETEIMLRYGLSRDRIRIIIKSVNGKEKRQWTP